MPGLAGGRAWGRWSALAALTLGVGLGRSGRLTYHEAFVAQAAREMIASGDLADPHDRGPPLAGEAAAGDLAGRAAGRAAGGVSEASARLPSAVAAALLAVGVAALAARRFGPRSACSPGLVQATTAWTVMRGRLAEADMLLACLVTWTLVAFDRLRDPRPTADGSGPRRGPGAGRSSPGLGLTALAKGIGSARRWSLAVVALLVPGTATGAALRRLRFGRAGPWPAALGLAWPVLAALRHPSALGLWALHVTDRLAARPEHFAGEPWWQYVPALLGRSCPGPPWPWSGPGRSLPRAVRPRGRGGRRPPALGLGGRAARPALAGDGQERRIT